VRGSDRKAYLDQVLDYPRLSVSTTNRVEAMIGLSRILIEEKQVRNLNEGIEPARRLS
jgi:hypothetical protein